VFGAVYVAVVLVPTIVPPLAAQITVLVGALLRVAVKVVLVPVVMLTVLGETEMVSGGGGAVTVMVEVADAEVSATDVAITV
jgi:hypothetical protein